MSSYFNRQTSKRDDRPHRSDPNGPHRPSGHERLGLPSSFATLPAPVQPSMGHQQQVPLHGLLGRGGIIPPPPGHMRASPSFPCPRCNQPFASPHERDQHSFACAASALLTGMFTPYSCAPHPQQPYQPPQPHDVHSSYPHAGQSAQPLNYQNYVVSGQRYARGQPLDGFAGLDNCGAVRPYSGQDSYGSTSSNPQRYGSYQSGTGRHQK